MNFDIIFERVIGHEAGFTDNLKDPGNWTGGEVGKGECKGTKFGIAANTYPDLDIKNLTEEQARAIYYEDWYIGNFINRFTPAMQFQMFDAAFNHGMKNASKMFQRAIGVKDDGFIGPITMAIAEQYFDAQLVYKFLGERVRFFALLKTFDVFGRGWMNRIAANLKYASEDVEI